MRILFLLTLFFVQFSLLAQSHLDKISPLLFEKIMEEPDKVLPVYVLLEDQVDILGLHKDLNDRKASLEERTYTVITTLQTKANQTQGSLLELLNHAEKVEQGSVKRYWITNVIQANIHASYIEELSRRADIGKLEYIEIKTLGDFKRRAVSPPSPNGSEPGLIAINAHKLWAMGYTGYGTRSFTIDSGVDRNHAALSGNYHGLYVGNDQAYTGQNPSGPTDCEGHGTSVTGCIAGLNRNNNDTIGVAFNATWMAGDHNNLVDNCPDAGLNGLGNFQWAMNPDNNASTTDDMPCVINNSWGSPNGCGNNSAESNAQNALEAAGVAVVWSAGNEGPGNNTTTFYADINTSLVVSFSVGAVNGNSGSLPIAGFSSRGPSSCGGSGALLIKPEVVAPGVNVRTANTGGSYTNIDGTSFSAPYVSGAILLLKEAFPNLTGEEIKFALYNSATDLGAPGEENTYGNGIINLEAAFEYLVNEGNTPVDPFVENDVLLVNLETDFRNCNGNIDASITFENAGTNNLSSLTVQYFLINSLGGIVEQGNFPWTGNLAPSERTDFMMPSISGPDGAYDFVVILNNPNGTTDTRPLNNRRANSILLSAADPLEIELIGGVQPCSGSNAILFVDFEDGEVNWYLDNNSNDPAGTGNYFEAPPLPIDFTYYADVNINGEAGIPDISSAPSNISSQSSGGLRFDAFTDFTLKSVKVFYDAPGIRLIQLRDGSNNTLSTKTVNLPAGLSEFVVSLDFDIDAGSGYVLVLGAGGTLYESTETNYPYAASGVMSITGTTDVPNPTEKYYFFYDWKICSSGYVCGRASFEVDVQNGGDDPEAQFTPSTLNGAVNIPINFSNESNNAVSYVWDFGDGNTSTDESPSYAYTDPGDYIVVLSAIDDTGCSDAAFIEITVDLELGTANDLLADNLAVFPNPATNEVFIKFDFPTARNVEWYLTDVLGRQVSDKSQQAVQTDQIRYDLENHTDGLYYFIFHINGQKIARKIIILK